ncbi:hypothetical protein L1987_25502 [Smallanthus sonchifolius]|uniref:Uncharacterized protein n=1 Tax=Smallanthus sonchifolius TaxID=185202 RepID=A0ACB9IQC9_9ASTR|nr:hypothetical protein L1987_25502 [Smallanthus sonchifolius]
MAEILPTLVTQLNQAAVANNSANSGSLQSGSNPPCTFKHFNSCNPAKFFGTEGATSLLQWFESMESTFLNSDCPDNLRVRHASSLMIEEFCPRNEMKKLEAEFWDLAQDSGENLVYTTRFHELSLLVPHMVTPLSRGIEKYISGLPMKIQDTVWGRNPVTLEDAIRLSATLTDNHVKAGTLFKKGSKKPVDTSTPEPLKTVKTEPSFNKKRKVRNYAVVTPAAPLAQVAPVKKPYGGAHPQCNTCKFHHPTTLPCRLCTLCGRYGNLSTTCFANKPPMVQGNRPNVPALPALANGRACFGCGDPTHFRNQCPRLANPNPNPGARGRAFNINTNEAQANTEVVNGTFLVNQQYASILFDTGADRSFVSLEFELLLAKDRSKLEKSITVEVADGNPVTIDSVIRDCVLNLNDHDFPINLIPMRLGSFDVIIGMDWLAEHHAEIICFEKCIRIPLPSGSTLQIYGEKSSSGLKLMSCTTARKYLRVTPPISTNGVLPFGK